MEMLKLGSRIYRAIQSFLAGMAVLGALLTLSVSLHAVVIAAIGSSAFLAFAMPTNPTSKPRNIIGGHIVGTTAGYLATFIPFQLVSYSTAVGLSILLMLFTGTEHPPASGTALGVALVGLSLELGVFIVVSCIVLSLAHETLKPWLRDI